MKFKSILTSAIAAVTLGTAAIAADIKVGFVYVGPVGDGGWTYEHDQGRKAVVEAFGDRVETIYQESVPEGADSERVMTQMALQGADLIFTTSFGYMDPTINVANLTHSSHFFLASIMGNAITQPARTIEKKVFGVEDRNKSMVVSSGVNNIHLNAAQFNVPHGTSSVGVGGGQVSFSTQWHG